MLSPTGIFASSIFVGSFFFTIGFDQGLDKFWDNWNKGVRGFRPGSSLAGAVLTLSYFAETMEGYSTQIHRGVLECFHCTLLADGCGLITSTCSRLRPLAGGVCVYPSRS